jgi:hypothetical protein
MALLLGLHEGTLPADQLAAARRHLTDCSRCRFVYATMLGPK